MGSKIFWMLDPTWARSVIDVTATTHKGYIHPSSTAARQHALDGMYINQILAALVL